MIELLRVAVLAVIWPWTFPSGHPERMESYEARLRTISEAVSLVAKDREEAAAIVVVWRRESRFRLDVHAGWTKGDRGRAACMGSIHPSKLVPDWTELAGTDIASTTRCARHTIRILRSGLWMCAHGQQTERAWAYAFEYYARGHCEEPGDESWSRAQFREEVCGAMWRSK